MVATHQHGTARRGVIISIAVGLVLAGVLWIVWGDLARTTYLILNITYFSSAELKEGRELARTGQSLVAAIHAFRVKRGWLPNKLSELTPDYLGADETKAWVYSQPKVSRFLLSNYAPANFYLYYEPKRGWLMTRDGDTGPISLGNNP